MILCEEAPPVTARWPRPTLQMGQALEHGQPLFKAALDVGWDIDEPNGIRSLGSEAALRFHLPETGAPVRLTVEGFALAPAHGGTQAVHVLVDGQPVAVWSVPDDPPTTMQAVLPAGTTAIRFHIDHPTRPLDRSGQPDTRLPSLFLMRLRFDPA